MRFRVFNAALTGCLIFALACLFERRAYAYIDPGSGILACQAVSAFLAGTLFYFRRWVRNLFHAQSEGVKNPLEMGGSRR
jgi:hypothetical protein